jgi:hypothetical protein
VVATRVGLFYLTVGGLLMVWAGTWATYYLLVPNDGLFLSLALVGLGYGAILFYSGIRHLGTGSDVPQEVGGQASPTNEEA